MEGHLSLPGAEWFPKQSGHSYCSVVGGNRTAQVISVTLMSFAMVTRSHPLKSLRSLPNRLYQLILQGALWICPFIYLFIYLLKGMSGGFTLPPFSSNH